MSPVAALLVAGTVWLVAPRRRASMAVAAATLAAVPVAGVGIGAVGGVLHVRRRLRVRRLSANRAAADVVALAELASLGLSAGLTAGQALEAAGAFVDPSIADEVRSVLRNAARRGLAAALSEAGGPGQRLFLILAQAVATGAPLAQSVDGFVADQQAEARAARLEDARRLPVRLMVPLALLVLPGFVLLTVGPTVLTALERLALPL